MEQWTHAQRKADHGYRTLFTTNASLENAKQLVSAYKQGKIRDMNKELWTAKKIIDATLHPGTDSPVPVVLAL